MARAHRRPLAPGQGNRGNISQPTTALSHVKKRPRKSTLVGRRYCRPSAHALRLMVALSFEASKGPARQHTACPVTAETQSLGPVRVGALASPLRATRRRLVSGSRKWATGGKTRRPTAGWAVRWTVDEWTVRRTCLVWYRTLAGCGVRPPPAPRLSHASMPERGSRLADGTSSGLQKKTGFGLFLLDFSSLLHQHVQWPDRSQAGTTTSRRR